jgi:hypothetical protein
MAGAAAEAQEWGVQTMKLKTPTLWHQDFLTFICPLARADSFVNAEDADEWAQEYAQNNHRQVWLVYTPAVKRTGDQPWAVWG